MLKEEDKGGSRRPCRAQALGGGGYIKRLIKRVTIINWQSDVANSYSISE